MAVATGPVGGILGSYDTLQQLLTAHPTGNQGDAYLVGGELYIWNTTTEMWESVGNLQGPTGPTGPTGENGADGIVGEIEGVVETVGDLPTTGIEAGTIYYVEEDGGIYIWDGTGWVLADVAQGPRGATGPTGPTGPQGADGIMGPIKGVVDTAADLPTTGVDQGDIYYVEGDGLYVWDATSGWRALGMVQGPRGATGPTGSAGPEASSYSIIPFASQIAPRTRIVNGLPSHVSLVGFGYGDARDQLGDLDDYAIAISSSDGHFDLGTTGNYQLVFSLPFDMTIRSIAFTTGNWADFPPTGTVFPYVQLYWAASESNTFMPIEGAVAKPAVGLGPGTVPTATMRSALTENLEINLPAGTRIAIGGLAEIEGDTGNHQYYLYYTGSIGLTRWVQ